MNHLMLITVLTVMLTMIGAQDPDQEKKDKIWKEYKEKYGFDKKFKDKDKEDNLRRGIFEENVKKIEKHNANTKKYYTQGVNQFTLMTNDEFRSKMLVNMTHFIEQDQKVVGSGKRSRRAIPVSKDWRTSGGIGPIRNQDECGSCWAFSTVATLEFYFWKKTGYLGDLSEQLLVDCVYPSRDGCNGGWMPTAYTYVNNHGGIAWEYDYPYQAQYDGACSASPPYRVVNYGYKTVGGSEGALQSYVATYGPVSACVDSTLLNFYDSGIFFESYYTEKTCNHAVNIVGYGVENNVPYWLIRNSWSTLWGEVGYMRLAAFRNNFLGIASYTYAPTF